ncbi:MAG: hypothetical protein WBG02_07010 [Candidatus Acidiferrum sp.]
MIPAITVRMEFSSHDEPVSSWASRRIRNCAVLALLLLGIGTTASGQTLVVTSGGSTVNQGDTLSINTIPNMPNLVLSVSGGASCDAFSYSIDVGYTDQSGYQTAGATYGGEDLPGNELVTVDWNGYLEGGTVTIYWTYNGVEESTFGFFINGLNPANSAVDAYLTSGGGPWFAQNLVAEESGAWTLSPTGQYKQFASSGYPL